MSWFMVYWLNCGAKVYKIFQSAKQIIRFFAFPAKKSCSLTSRSALAD